MLTVWAKSVHHSLLHPHPLCLWAEAFSPVEATRAEISSYCLLIQLVYNAPPLCLSVCNTLSPCSTVYNKHAKLPDCCDFSIWEPSSPTPAFVHVFIFSSLPQQPNQVSPWSCEDTAPFFLQFSKIFLSSMALLLFQRYAQCTEWNHPNMFKLAIDTQEPPLYDNCELDPYLFYQHLAKLSSVISMESIFPYNSPGSDKHAHTSVERADSCSLF